jgi:carbon-monoxide dehydrogenase small subunit
MNMQPLTDSASAEPRPADDPSLVPLRFRLNGVMIETRARPDMHVVDLLREELGLMGAKIGCGIGRCGACTIIVNGKAVNACLLMAYRLEGADVITIEGLATLAEGRIVMDAFTRGNAFQCGYCAPGMTLAMTALLLGASQPDEADIREALGGNICRCTGYLSILRAAFDAVEDLKALGKA